MEHIIPEVQITLISDSNNIKQVWARIIPKKRLPVKLVYFEEFERIDDAFYREKQIQGWSKKKKEALINEKFDSLPNLSIAYRDRNKK